MTDTFRALLIDKTDEGQSVAYTQLTDADLMEGDVTVRVTHSTVNYKDGLAITGKAPILRKYPLIPGIDFSGEVIASGDARYQPGDNVICTGWGVGEAHHGGFSERARVPGEWLVPVPEGWSNADAMTMATAGFTAMLCVLRLEDLGLTPEAGDVVVTGAAGGVGSVAVALLATAGYSVYASTGRPEEVDYFKTLGAKDIVHREEFSGKARPLSKARWAGAVDVVGSSTLANVIAQMKYHGIVTACGLAQGADLPANVMPFILRAVTLAGVESVTVPREARLRAWARLAQDIDMERMKAMTSHIGFDDLAATADKIVRGQTRGRVVVDIA
ncbi:MAG: oxidoreductase [Hyphomicrobiales bacterium]|nr:MAG: oxidoreductase [Hyphomicrobiales bacterium]